MKIFKTEHKSTDIITLRRKFAFSNVRLYDGRNIWFEYYLEVTKTRTVGIRLVERINPPEVVNLLEEDYTAYILTNGLYS